MTDPGLIADRGHLQHAIELAQRCPLSRTASSMGVMIIDAEGAVLATGYSRETDPPGHAEQAALVKLTPDDTRLGNATLYSSLESCSTALRDPAAALSSYSLPGLIAATPAVSSGQCISCFHSAFSGASCWSLEPQLFPGSPGQFRCDLVEFCSGVTRQLGSLGRYCRSSPFPRLNPRSTITGVARGVHRYAGTGSSRSGRRIGHTGYARGSRIGCAVPPESICDFPLFQMIRSPSVPAPPGLPLRPGAR